LRLVNLPEVSRPINNKWIFKKKVKTWCFKW